MGRHWQQARKLEYRASCLCARFNEDGETVFTTDFNGQLFAWMPRDGKRIGEGRPQNRRNEGDGRAESESREQKLLCQLACPLKIGLFFGPRGHKAPRVGRRIRRFDLQTPQDELGESPHSDFSQPQNHKWTRGSSCLKITSEKRPRNTRTPDAFAIKKGRRGPSPRDATTL